MRSIYIKRLCYILMILCVYAPNVFALSLSSNNYTINAPRIIISGGYASSQNYSINSANVGSVFSGMAESQNYSLDTISVKKKLSPNRPTLNQVTSPTNVALQRLSGTKDIATSIYINGYEVVALDNSMSWSYDKTLTEGDNHLIITTRNASGLESEPLYITITLDTIPPQIIISNPLDGTIVYTDPINVEGTIDGVPFSEARDIVSGPNEITIEASDEAGNVSYDAIEVYLIREPLALPE